MGEGIFHADALHVHPLRGARQPRRVVADELLAEVEFPSLQEPQERSKGERGHYRQARLPRVPHLDDNRALGFQELTKARGEAREPADVFLALKVSVLFLPVERERRRREDQLNLALVLLGVSGVQELLECSMQGQTTPALVFLA